MRPSTITLVLGGTRSGKSALAERLALAGTATGPVWYLATGSATDADMAARIDAHRHRRHQRFRTVECGTALPEALLATLVDPPAATTTSTELSTAASTDLATDLSAAPALVDALGTWVAACPDLTPDTGALLAALESRRTAGAATVLVSDEVGMGVHPPSAAGRRFRDALGALNAAVADVADVVLLAVAGRALRLDRLEQVVEQVVEDVVADVTDPVVEP